MSQRPLRLRNLALAFAVASLLLALLLPSAPSQPPAPSETAPARRGRTLAVLLNGGGRREINYRSHLEHVRTLLALLRAGRVAPANVAVFSADGNEADTDLATRELLPEPTFWLLPQRLAGALRPAMVYVNSTIDGVTLRPARRDALREWFARYGAALRAGDTLLFYVTDHGELNEKDNANNTITLWGESLSVAELRELFALVDPRVRIVMVMSQCFAGSFAHAIYDKPQTGADGAARVATTNGAPRREAPALPGGNVCGYFAVTADRMAYGCYPENRGKDGVGHSHHLFQALERLGRFDEAHRRVLVADGSPDVPHTTVDFFLERVLREDAEKRELPLDERVDELLAEAWQQRAAWEPEIRLLDRIGQTFGSFSPRSLTELGERTRLLQEFSKRLATYAERWQEALESLRRANLERFLETNPAWKDRLTLAALEGLDTEQRQRTASDLLAELGPATERDTRRHARLVSLEQKARDAAAASYRAEVRLGVVLRMRALLITIAGRVLAERHAPPEVAEALARLVHCEDLALLPRPAAPTAAALEDPEPFPPLAEEQRLVEALMPAYMGIQFRPVSETLQERGGLEKGAVTVLTVHPDSPAAEAGLEVGDVVLGPPDAPFTEPHQVREWTMLSEIGVPAPLTITRDGRPLEITLAPGPYPLELPPLPGPPKVGAVAPPLKVSFFRGADAFVEGRPRLLFFWATWCTICKYALPETLAFAAARGVDVVTITDEEPETLFPFFDDWHQPFPDIVALDPLRMAFQNYGVSGTPTFVLVDAKGIVRHYQTGYRDGLRVEGWKWQATR